MAPPAPGAGPGPLQLMIRALLAERFKLAVHNETKDSPIYALILARSDGKLGPQTEEIRDRLRRAVRGRARARRRDAAARTARGRANACRAACASGRATWMGGAPLMPQFAQHASACSPAASCSIAPASTGPTTST